MSWATGSEPLVVSSDDTKALRDHKGSYQDGYAESESKAAHKSAVAAAADLIESGILGAGEFYVSASGHSNPGGEPESGWSEDYLSIHVARVPAPRESAGEVVIDEQKAVA